MRSRNGASFEIPVKDLWCCFCTDNKLCPVLEVMGPNAVVNEVETQICAEKRCSK
jgi:hypothetical protein